MSTASITEQPFGTTPQGESVSLYTLVNVNGLHVQVINYGGIVVSLHVPDRHGKLADVVLGYDDMAGFAVNRPYFGAIVGRVVNRIAGGRFALNGIEYTLARNEGDNHLHGGLRAFDKAVWPARALDSIEGPALQLRHRSAHGEEGYPGTVDVAVTYTLTRDDALRIDYLANTDRATLLNLSNHAYFNLRDGGRSDILGHHIAIHASHFTAVDASLIPTGEIRAVAGTPFDFRQPTAIGVRIAEPDPQLLAGGGYDHNYVVDGEPGKLRVAAQVYEPDSGRTMEVHTTQPGVQFYCGNFLDGTIAGKGGTLYAKRHGFCLETQHFPDAPHHPQFPSIVLEPQRTYRQTTAYRFGVRR